MKKSIITGSYKETQKLGAGFIKKTNNSRIIALYGDLGSGKTTFVQGLAQGLSIHNKIISPSFIIMRTYNIPIGHQSSTLSHFYHIDLYRLTSVNEIKDLGLIELMQDPKNLLAIEWPEKIESILPENTLRLNFSYLNENKRQIEILKA